MAIRSKNISDNNSYNEFAQQIIPLPVNIGASHNANAVEVVMPWAGKLISASFRCSQLTDADDSARVKVIKNTTDLVAAAVDPVAADTTTTFTLNATTFAAGAILKGHVLTGAGDAIVGTFLFVVRPYLGVLERVGAGLGEA